MESTSMDTSRHSLCYHDNVGCRFLPLWCDYLLYGNAPFNIFCRYFAAPPSSDTTTKPIHFYHVFDLELLGPHLAASTPCALSRSFHEDHGQKRLDCTLQTWVNTASYMYPAYPICPLGVPSLHVNIGFNVGRKGDRGDIWGLYGGGNSRMQSLVTLVSVLMR